MKHWAIDLIGKPFEKGGRGPNGFDCWGLVYWRYLTHYGIKLPDYFIEPEDHLAVCKALKEGEMTPDRAWIHIETPIDNCGVGLSHNYIFHHVGLWTNAGGGFVLHAHPKSGVIAQSVRALKAQGWSRIEFYRHKDVSC